MEKWTLLHVSNDKFRIASAKCNPDKPVKDAQLKVYKGGAHGMCTTQKDAVTPDLLAFIAQ